MDALRHEFLKAIHENHERPSETGGGCTLRVKHEMGVIIISERMVVRSFGACK